MCEIIDDCELDACRTGDCVDKVNGYTCDGDEDHELMLQINGSACVACENFLLQRVQIEGVRCDTVLAESAEINDTCIRPRRCVCGSTCNDGRTRAHVTNTSPASVQSSSQRVGALSLIPSCLGISGHPSGSRQGHPRCAGARSAGSPWVARLTVQHISTVQKHPKHHCNCKIAIAI